MCASADPCRQLSWARFSFPSALPSNVKPAEKRGHYGATFFSAASRIAVEFRILSEGDRTVDSSPGEITRLLIELRAGSPDAEARLIPLVYGELHRLAAHYMRGERRDHTLQPTALVNEAYMRLTAHRDIHWRDRAHFFGFAARLMRQVLMQHARAHQAEKRGGFVRKFSLDEALDFSPDRSKDLIALDDALKSLEQLSPRQGRVVELRFFGGLTVEETAEVLGTSPRTVKRDWNVARAWLHGELRH